MDRWMCQYSFRGLTVHTDISPSVIYCAVEELYKQRRVLRSKTDENSKSKLEKVEDDLAENRVMDNIQNNKFQTMHFAASTFTSKVQDYL